MSTSQPLAASRSQSPKGAMHIDTAQVPLAQAGEALATVHCRPQPPQCAVFAWGSTQPPLQHDCPVGQARPGLHPATQTLPTQSVPAGQCASTTHATHARLLALSALMGGVLLMAADIGARWLVAPQELPVGVLTAVLGGGYLLWLMHRRRVGGGL